MSLHLGDCLAVLKSFAPNSFDSVVTDPPYGLSFMGKKWDYDVPSVELWREVFRVLKPGGHVLSFGGTRTYHRMVVNIEDAGFEIRDQIMWIYGSGFPKSHNGAHGGTALKPANEPIVMARKPLIGTVAANFEQFGTGGLNIDASRIATSADDAKSMERANSPNSGRNKSHAATKSSMGRPTISGAMDTTQGRWPANILFDEESAAVLDAQSEGTRASKPSASGRSTKNAGSSLTGMGGVDNNPSYTDSGGASRFFYVAKASKRERGEGNVHPTVKPIKLMEYLVRLVTPPGGTVLDPFMGSGTTGVACSRLGFHFQGIERDIEYFRIAGKRIDASTQAAEEKPVEDQLAFGCEAGA